MSRWTTAALVTAAVLCVACTDALAEGAGKARFVFWGGFGAAARCDGSGIVNSPATVPAPAFGFAIATVPDGRLRATVVIHDIPNGYYTVRLVQGLDDCRTTDWAGFTNGDGDATVHLSEPAVSSTAFVAVDQWATYERVPVSVNASFVTSTYWH